MRYIYQILNILGVNVFQKHSRKKYARKAGDNIRDVRYSVLITGDLTSNQEN